MAIVQRFGKPDYFIPMTCNSYWDEIVCNLEPSQTPQDRPELVSRVYNSKLRDFKNLLIKKKNILDKLQHIVMLLNSRKEAWHMSIFC